MNFPDIVPDKRSTLEDDILDQVARWMRLGVLKDG
jgi:hypothetical protein